MSVNNNNNNHTQTSSSKKMVDLHRLAQAMCSMDLVESHWTQVSYSKELLGILVA